MQVQRNCCPVVELRQYTLYPGKREVLIELFERALIESQEEVGMSVIGQFRDLERPDRFVWLRGFPDMETRRAALQAFYGGPVWKEHRNAANATMIDSDNVLLLKPAFAGTGFALDGAVRLPYGTPEQPRGLLVATMLYFEEPPPADLLAFFQERVVPFLRKKAATPLACFVTEASTNTFPALPVREGEQVFAWFSAYRDLATYEELSAQLEEATEWREQLWNPIQRYLRAEPEILKLAPTTRSLLHG